MKDKMRFFLAAMLLMVGIGIIVTNPITEEILITGMVFISISVISSAFMLHFPSEKPKKRKK